MRVLILGATGFVGGHLRRECLGRGDRVSGTFLPGETIPSGDDVEWFEVDLLDPPSIERALEGARPEGIVHLAGQADVALGNRDPVGTFRVNAEGTYRVLASIRERAPDARTVIVTSAEVYGAVPEEELPVRETRPLEPRTPYGVSKAAADLAAAQAASAWGLFVIRMRPFNHVGPGQRIGFVAPDFASRIVAIERGLSPPELRVGNLSGRRDFTDVRDIVVGYRTALDRGAAGRAYNLCSGRSTLIEDVVRFFVEKASIPVEVRRDEKLFRAVDVPEFRGDPGRARSELDWRAGISLEESLAEVLEEWRRSPQEALPRVD